MSEQEQDVTVEAEEMATEDAAVAGEIVDEAEAVSAEMTVEQQLEAAQAEAAKNLDGWQRTMAEFANARRRMEKERIDARSNATVTVAKDLLPVIDDLSRAIESAPEAVSEDSWFVGLEMVQRKLNSILTNHKIEAIDVIGEEFDPNLHEAVMQDTSDEFESGVVTRELQKGYKIGDRVVRPALVAVAA